MRGSDSNSRSKLQEIQSCFFSLVWTMVPVSRCSSAVQHGSQNMLRLPSADCNAGFTVSVNVGEKMETTVEPQLSA